MKNKMSETDWDRLTTEQQNAVNAWRDRVGKMIASEGEAFEALHPELRLTWNFTSEPLLRSEHPVIYEGL